MQRKKKLYILTLLAVLIMGIAVICIVFRDRDSISGEKQEKFELDLKSDLPEESNNPYDIRVNFEELQKTNSDIYAWIKIPETNIDYPILQSKEEPDEYYLNHTSDKKEELPGSIYTEKYNTIDFSDPVTIIYGHALKDGTMFSELKKYRDEEFFETSPYIYIYLPTERLKYQIFSAVVFDDRYILGNYDFRKPEEVETYIAELKACTEGNINPKIRTDDRIITLSTCIDESPEQRWLVCAVLVETQKY